MAKIGAHNVTHRPRISVSRWVVFVILAFGAVVCIYPFIWMFATAIKSQQEIAVAPLSLWPAHRYWSNFVDALTAFPLLLYLRNTVLTTFIPIIGTCISNSLIAFAFSRIRVRGSNVIFMIVLATMLLPGEVTLIPQFVLFRSLGLINTLYPLILPSFFGSPFFIFLLRQFYARLPMSLEESAFMDGAGFFRIWWSIFLPLSRPAMIAVGVMSFMSNWNNFLGPLMYINTDNWKTLSIGLAGFQSEHSTQTNLLMAATIIIILPCVILFFSAQRAFVEGITFSGSKE